MKRLILVTIGLFILSGIILERPIEVRARFDTPKSDEFAIYTYFMKDIKTEDLSKYSMKELVVEKSIITLDDVIGYYWNKNVIKVKKGALERNDIKKVYTGWGFSVVAQGETIYKGYFWSVAYSSLPGLTPHIYEEGLLSQTPGNLDTMEQYNDLKYLKSNDGELFITICGDSPEMKDERIYSVLKAHNKLIEEP